ncbi:MAG: hypothetical protein GOU97_03895 [Nanoarchaeota archaeon]|nr:hypothetical protein [Nanoarchaeota archaeon]
MIVDDIVKHLPDNGYDKLFVSDLEGTLTRGFSVFEKLNKELGVSGEQDYKFYQRFIDSDQTLEDQREWNSDLVSIWLKGEGKEPSKDFIEGFVKSHYEPIEGAKEFVSRLQEEGFLVAVVSNGLTSLCSIAQKDLGFDFFTPPQSIIYDSKGLVSSIESCPYFFGNKVNALTDLYTAFELKYGQAPSVVAAMGDSDNDFEFLLKASSLKQGTGFLINPSKKLMDKHKNVLLGGGVELVPNHDYDFVLSKLGV